MSGSMDGAYDPERHENQVLALFEDRRRAEGARRELLNAGVPAEAIQVIDKTAQDQSGKHQPLEEGGFWAAVTGLFAPDQDVDELGQALGRGHALVVATPESAAERETVIEVLEGLGPLEVGGLDVDTEVASDHGPATPSAPVDHTRLNHATLSRADMAGHALPGHMQPMLDMSGQPMSVRVLSDEEAAAVADASQLPPAEQAEVPAEPMAAERAQEPRVTYTYGVPETMAGPMSRDEQIEAQAPATAEQVVSAEPGGRKMVRIVEERMRVGWREQHARAVRVRSYVAEKRPGTQRVELLEEEIGTPTEPGTSEAGGS